MGYYCTDQWGRPANGGDTSSAVRAGLMQDLAPPLKICDRGYHATREPHRWAGCRVWIVALHGSRQERDGKAAALRREIVGEVLPSDVIDQQVAARIGLRIADLGGADLAGANLAGADLGGANLTRADLTRANLAGADLTRADLGGANLTRADLGGADLGGADRPGWLPACWKVTPSGLITEAT